MSKSDRFVPATSGVIVTHIFSSRQWRIMIKKVARPSKTCRCLYRRTLNVHLRRFNAAIRFQDGGGSRQQQPKDPPRMKCCTIWIWRFSGGFLFFFFCWRRARWAGRSPTVMKKWGVRWVTFCDCVGRTFSISRRRLAAGRLLCYFHWADVWSPATAVDFLH